MRFGKRTVLLSPSGQPPDDLLQPDGIGNSWPHKNGYADFSAMERTLEINDRILRQHPQVFEKSVLIASARSVKFYLCMRTRLCPFEPARKGRRPDFTKPEHNQIFGLIADYWELWMPQLDLSQDYPITLENLEEMMRSEMTNGRISQDDAIKVFGDLKDDYELITFSPEVLSTFHNNEQIATWLDRRAARNIIEFAFSNRMLRHPSLAELKKLVTETEISLGTSVSNASTALGALPRSGPNYSKHLVGNRWLYRGSSIMFVGPTGTGKSSFAVQLGIHFASGKLCFGLKPIGPLRILYIQAENDLEDVAEVRDDVYKGLAFSAADQNAANQNFNVIQKVDATGSKFISWLTGVLATHPCDILIIDPLMAYIGGDVTQQSVTSAFLREGLQPLISKHSIGVIVVHHPPKPRIDQPKETAQSDSYYGAGSADIANWVRGVMALKPTRSMGLFKLRLPKRGKRAGWFEADGITLKFEMDVAHGQGGLIYWREADANEGFTPKRQDTTRADILALIPTSGQILQTKVIANAREKSIGRGRVLETLNLLTEEQSIHVIKIPRAGCRPAVAYTRDKA